MRRLVVVLVFLSLLPTSAVAADWAYYPKKKRQHSRKAFEKHLDVLREGGEAALAEQLLREVDRLYALRETALKEAPEARLVVLRAPGTTCAFPGFSLLEGGFIVGWIANPNRAIPLLCPRNSGEAAFFVGAKSADPGELMWFGVYNLHDVKKKKLELRPPVPGAVLEYTMRSEQRNFPPSVAAPVPTPETLTATFDENGIAQVTFQDTDYDVVVEAPRHERLSIELKRRQKLPVLTLVAFDPDGDGFEKQADRCPEHAEDADGWEDADGCPEPATDTSKIWGSSKRTHWQKDLDDLFTVLTRYVHNVPVRRMRPKGSTRGGDQGKIGLQHLTVLERTGPCTFETTSSYVAIRRDSSGKTRDDHLSEVRLKIDLSLVDPSTLTANEDDSFRSVDASVVEIRTGHGTGFTPNPTPGKSLEAFWYRHFTSLDAGSSSVVGALREMAGICKRYVPDRPTIAAVSDSERRALASTAMGKKDCRTATAALEGITSYQDDPGFLVLAAEAYECTNDIDTALVYYRAASERGAKVDDKLGAILHKISQRRPVNRWWLNEDLSTFHRPKPAN